MIEKMMKFKIKKLLYPLIILTLFPATVVFAESFEALLEKANNGDVKAQYQVGYLYSSGNQGVSFDEEKGVFWFKKAAEAGDAKSQLSLAMSYLWGSGVSKNSRKGIEWLTKSANQNNAMAQYNLAEEYADGKNINKDQDLANYWYLKSAENGDVSAQFKLGSLYLDGNSGLPQDINKAKAWLKKAADQGYELAQRQLAAL